MIYVFLLKDAIESRVRTLEDNDDKPNIPMIGAYITIPFVQAIPPIIGWFIGRWLDSVFGVAPYIMYTFMILGFIAGFREVYRIIRKFGNKT